MTWYEWLAIGLSPAAGTAWLWLLLWIISKGKAPVE
jgi:hypothetical protein